MSDADAFEQPAASAISESDPVRSLARISNAAPWVRLRELRPGLLTSTRTALNGTPIGSRRSPTNSVDCRGDLVETYAAHPEAKALGPNGRPCGRGTVGLFQRRPVIAGEIELIGKESNRLEDRFTGLLTVDELDERLTVYHDDDGWRRSTLPRWNEYVDRTGRRAMAQEIGMNERRLRDILKGRARPHPRLRKQLEEFGRQLPPAQQVTNPRPPGT